MTCLERTFELYNLRGQSGVSGGGLQKFSGGANLEVVGRRPLEG